MAHQNDNEFYHSPNGSEIVMTLDGKKNQFEVVRYFDDDNNPVMRLTISDCVHVYMPEIQMFQYLMSAIAEEWWEQTDITISTTPHPFDLEEISD